MVMLAQALALETAPVVMEQVVAAVAASRVPGQVCGSALLLEAIPALAAASLVVVAAVAAAAVVVVVVVVVGVLALVRVVVVPLAPAAAAPRCGPRRSITSRSTGAAASCRATASASPSHPPTTH